MYVCNMLSGDEALSFRGNTFSYKSDKNVTEGFLSLKKDGSIVGPVSQVSDDEKNLFLEGLTNEDKKAVYRTGKPNGRKGNLTYEMIEDTPDNPLIVVFCKTITFYENIEADIRFVNIGSDAICAMLVSGACAFDDTPMQRCNTQVYNNVTEYTYDAKSLRDISDQFYKDSKSGYSYGNDVLNTLVITRSDESSINIKCSQQDRIFIDRTKLDREVAKYEERRLQAQAKLDAEREERNRLGAIAKAKVQAELMEKARKDQEKLEAIQNKAKLKAEKKVAQKTVEGSAGAAAFLAAVRGL